MSDPYRTIIQCLSDDGTASGNHNMAVNGSVTPQEFWFEPASAYETADVARVIFLVRDAGTWTASSFGSIAELTNGVEFGVYDASDNLILDITAGMPVTNNGLWSAMMFDARLDTYGNGDSFLTGRLTFSKFANNGLHLTNGQKLKMIINDDLTGLELFSMTAEGYYVR